MSALGKPSALSFPSTPTSKEIKYETEAASGLCRGVVIEFLMTVHAIDAHIYPDKRHHAFAGPLGFKGFDIKAPN
jgi:hypothetical protein